MIKLALAIRDEKYLQQLINRLRREKDISILSAIIIKDINREVKQVLAFMNQMIEQKPDIFLFEQVIVREVAAVDLDRTLDYRNKMPAMKTIIVGERFNEENVMALMMGGAQGFFRTELGEEQLIKCIHVVDQGEIWLDAEMTTRIFKEFIKESMKKKELLKSLADLSSEKLDTLSPREMEVMELISRSMTNDEIAGKLFVSPKTIKTHLRNIFIKAEIKNRVEAALLYTRHALKSH